MSLRSRKISLQGSSGLGSLLGVVLAVGGVVGMASNAAAADAAKLTLYSAQHEQMVDMLTSGFTKQTGIEVVVHKGECGGEIDDRRICTKCGKHLTVREAIAVDGPGMKAARKSLQAVA